jgi:hypothetical protein
MDMFNNIIIGRYDDNGNEVGQINVPCVQGHRSEILKSIENREKTRVVPMISIYTTNQSRDTSRATDTNIGVLKQGSTYNDLLTSPIPYNIKYNMDIIAMYQSDIDQILNNFIVYFNPSAYIVVPHPFGGDPLKVQVIWSGSTQMSYNNNYKSGEPYKIVASTSFAVRTWLFPGNTANSSQYDNTGPKIKHINSALETGSFGSYTKAINIDDFTNNTYTIPDTEHKRGSELIVTTSVYDPDTDDYINNTSIDYTVSSTGITINTPFTGIISIKPKADNLEGIFNVPNYMTFADYHNSVYNGIITGDTASPLSIDTQ